MDIDFSALEKNVTGVVSEQQIKLGYRSEVVRLYYPLLSLNRILHTNDSFMQMLEHLEQFSQYARRRLGRIEVTSDGERFCLAIPPVGSEYIHSLTEKNEFLNDFIGTIRHHSCTIEDVVKVFRKYSTKVHAEKVQQDDFDYLLYFEDGKPDDYRYCLTSEGGHLIYHRFTKEDFDSLSNE